MLRQRFTSIYIYMGFLMVSGKIKYIEKLWRALKLILMNAPIDGIGQIKSDDLKVVRRMH